MASYRIQSFTTNNDIIDLDAEPQALIFNQSDLISSNEPITQISVAGNIEIALEPYLLKSGGTVNGILELNAEASLRFSDSTQQTTAFSTTKDNLLNEHEGKISTLFNNDTDLFGRYFSMLCSWSTSKNIDTHPSSPLSGPIFVLLSFLFL
jgi:hypothetical protein